MNYTYEDKQTGFKTNDMAEYQLYMERKIKDNEIKAKLQPAKKKFFANPFKRKKKVIATQPIKEETKMDFIVDQKPKQPEINFDGVRDITPVELMIKEFPKLQKEIQIMREDFSNILCEMQEIRLNINGIYEEQTKPKNVFVDPTRISGKGNTMNPIVQIPHKIESVKNIQEINKGKDFRIGMIVNENQVGNFITTLQERFNIEIDTIEILETPDEKLIK